jgi:DNA polymerase I-like protein with 3'-5' exonuclease and polymerase domains
LVLPTGRRFKFRPTGWGGKYNEREIKNYPVQGMAGGDILPLAAVIIRKNMRKRGFVSKMILTVHDSIVFDYKESEKKDLAKLCLSVFSNLPKYIKQYWGINWIVNLEGECEIGENYGSQTEYIP